MSALFKIFKVSETPVLVHSIKNFPELEKEIPKLFNILIKIKSANKQYEYLNKLYIKNMANYTPTLKRIILTTILYLEECIKFFVIK